jgi:tRNA-specific 2-thiouridylase
MQHDTAAQAELTPPPGAHVIVGMSGGVDSSVTAWLLLRAGYRVTGVFMQNWEDNDEACTARQDYRDAAGVANTLGIPLETVNFAEEYWSDVFKHFLAEYQTGRTPNPDILCNREIKFKAFLEHAEARGADAIATGHYVRRGLSETGSWQLLRGLDNNKDQSYFLHQLGQAQIAPSLFPVGELDKSEVRKLAHAAGLHVHTKKDSTGICFIGERKFTAFLSDYLPNQPGDIVDETGTVIGRHTGLMYHTYGQRQGLGIGGLDGAEAAPWYVLDKDLEHNRLIVGQGHDNPRLLRRQLDAIDIHWVAGMAPSAKFTCTARVRYRQQDVAADVVCDDKGSVSVTFDTPVRAITPGQSVVFYSDDCCLGGGVINTLGPSMSACYGASRGPSQGTSSGT